MDKFTINYDKRTLVLSYKNGLYFFDLNEGDIGDFWHYFYTDNGEKLAINYHQELGYMPNLEIWDYTDDYSFNECIEVIDTYELFGTPENYFINYFILK
jgi:hypothetical protein